MTALETSLTSSPTGNARQLLLKRKRPLEKFSLQSQMKHILKSQSVPTLLSAHNTLQAKTSTTTTITTTTTKPVTDVNPQTCLENIFRTNGRVFKVHSCDALPDFFEDLKQEEVDAYGFDVLQAVRESDIDTLRQYHKEGRPLKCSNRFGESLLHLACRKALVPVVDFLINEVGVPLCVKDDMGRTPLADAFWTIDPHTELVEILLRKCPDLLLVSDKRGHTPLSYARRHHWAEWNEYLTKKSPAMLFPKILNP